MGGKGGGEKPPTIGQSQQVNTYNAALQQQANMVDQVTPFGTVKYAPAAYDTFRVPWGHNEVEMKTAPTAWSASTTLNPQTQALLDSYMKSLQGMSDMAVSQQGRVSGLLSTPLALPDGRPTTGDLPAAYEGKFDFGDMPTIDEGARDNMLKSLMAFQQPQVEQDRASLATKLANQGVSAGSDAYRNSFRGLEDQVARNRLGAVTTAADQARADQALNLQSRGQMFGEEADRMTLSDARRTSEWNLMDASRRRELEELLMLRNQPLQELLALTGAAGGGIQMPGSAAAAVPQTQIQNPTYYTNTSPDRSGQAMQAGTSVLSSAAMAAAVAF